jgi:hypothetical protein
MLGRSTTYSTDIEDAGSALLGSAWGGVHAADTLPPAAHHLTCRVVNTASTDDGTNGVHWCACVEEGGRRYFNDALGAAGRRQRADLARRYPDAEWADDDAEQRPEQTDCGVRALVALVIARDGSVDDFMHL